MSSNEVPGDGPTWKMGDRVLASFIVGNRYEICNGSLKRNHYSYLNLADLAGKEGIWYYLYHGVGNDKAYVHLGY